MSINTNLQSIKTQLPEHVTLVAVSKTKPLEDLQAAYQAGQRIFGENKVQEMVEKYDNLPKDIAWHMIGHLQRNKVKYMAHFVDLIHGVDNLNLLIEINKQAKKHNRIINCLIQVKIAQEDSKFGLSTKELENLLKNNTLNTLENIKIIGVMGMATFTEDTKQIRNEFMLLKQQFELYKTVKTHNIDLQEISMGMSGDYKLAIDCGSTMVRVGSAIFGNRNYTL